MTLLKSLNAKIDKNHVEVLSQLNEVKEIQMNLEKKVTDINTRLIAVEEKIAACDGGSGLDISRSVSDTVRIETDSLHHRLDEFEDRSRRQNLIFYGLPDGQTESWTESETKIRELLSSTLEMELPHEAIERAHRLGKFVPNKCRPVIAKFSHFKTKDSIFSSRSQLKDSGVSISEDFCMSTRNTRKKLTEFGKASGQQFFVRYNKLIINKKCYVYVSSTDSVCEINLHDTDASTRSTVSGTPGETNTNSS